MADEPEIRFEAALEQLEKIVDDLQRGEPELSSALVKYEKGVALLGQCYGLLERAERSVSILTGVDDAGEAVTTSFDAAATLTVELAKPAAAAEDKPEAPKAARRRRVKPAAEPITEPEPESAPEPETAPEPEYDRFDPPF